MNIQTNITISNEEGKLELSLDKRRGRIKITISAPRISETSVTLPLAGFLTAISEINGNNQSGIFEQLLQLKQEIRNIPRNNYYPSSPTYVPSPYNPQLPLGSPYKVTYNTSEEKPMTPPLSR